KNATTDGILVGTLMQSVSQKSFILQLIRTVALCIVRDVNQRLLLLFRQVSRFFKCKKIKHQ
ncbi:MAG: hypothetical protein V2I33_04025, partial [Kangiellaceae bacterium]|nr:hypothetical protein [Kangiellaceae bacterium]